MKAYLLAAGEGRRLRPITENLPKCLVPIDGNPLMRIWLEFLKNYNVTEVFINTSYHSNEIEEFLSSHDWGIKLTTSFEKKLLGSAGTIYDNRGFVNTEKEFLIIYADNLTNTNLNKIIEFHRGKKSDFTMGLFHTDKPQECGMVELDKDNKIIKFIEKPKNSYSNLANAGIYVSSQRIFDYIPRKRPVDFGFDILPKLIGKMYGYIIEDYYIDIGTVDNYKKACNDWKEGLIAGGKNEENK